VRAIVFQSPTNVTGGVRFVAKMAYGLGA
jgi:hypothetical protein